MEEKRGEREGVRRERERGGKSEKSINVRELLGSKEEAHDKAN